MLNLYSSNYCNWIDHNKNLQVYCNCNFIFCFVSMTLVFFVCFLILCETCLRSFKYQLSFVNQQRDNHAVTLATVVVFCLNICLYLYQIAECWKKSVFQTRIIIRMSSRGIHFIALESQASHCPKFLLNTC